MEVTAPKPTTVICPVCNAQVGDPCTQPDDRSRHNVKFFHFARLELANNPPEPELDVELQQLLDSTQEKILELPEELQPEQQWEIRGEFEIHTPCGQVFVPGSRALHEAACPSLTMKLTAEQLAEVRKRPSSVTRDESDERAIRMAMTRYERYASSPRPHAERFRAEATAILRASGLQRFHVYSEGYAATGERGGATSHGTHWGRDFNDAIERWAREDHSAARYLSKRTNSLGQVTWTYWGCKLFDNLSDAQRSFG